MHSLIARAEEKEGIKQSCTVNALLSDLVNAFQNVYNHS